MILVYIGKNVEALPFSHFECANLNYENLLNFSESLYKYTDYEIIIYKSLSEFATDMNIRRVLANLYKFSINGGKVRIVDSFKSEKFSIIVRCLRSIGIIENCFFQYENDFFDLQFKCEGVLASNLNEFHKFIPNIGGKIVAELIRDKIIKKSSLSLIRIGHCEVKFIAYNYFFGDNDLKNTYQIQWGVESIEVDDFNFVKNGLLNAVKASKIVGYNLPSALSTEPLKILENAVSKVLCDFSLIDGSIYRVKPNIHWELALSNEFLSALSYAKKIVLITPRLELLALFEKLYPKIEIVILTIPGEHKIDGKSDLKRRFSIFREVDCEVNNISKPGIVFLVGAGVAGKRFLATAFNKGAVAIDMGSALDAWAGIDSRGSGFDGKFSQFIQNYIQSHTFSN